MQTETQKIEEAITTRTNKHGDPHEGERENVLALVFYYNQLPLTAEQSRLVFDIIN